MAWSVLPPPILVIALALTGAVIGSFLTVVIHRLPRMIDREAEDDGGGRFDLALPPSGCPVCGHRLRPWENVPVVSFLALGGRCAVCRTAIGWTYPVVEIAALAAGPLLALRFGLTGPGLAATLSVTVFLWFAIAITVIDLRHLLIPDLLSLSLLWVGLLVACRGVFVPADAAILGALAGYLSFWVVSRAGRAVYGRPAMGLGDVKLFAAGGAWVGADALPLVALTSCLLGSVVGLILMMLGRHGRREPLPFGPFLLAGTLAVLIAGPALRRGQEALVRALVGGLS